MDLEPTKDFVQIGFLPGALVLAFLTYRNARKTLLSPVNTEYQKRIVCFTECPLSAVKLFASGPEVKEAKYRFYGIAISKKAAFKNGAIPVIYLPDDEGDWIPTSEKWRHVRFEYGSVDWTFEREWRKREILN